jgi:hypothetical protein
LPNTAIAKLNFTLLERIPAGLSLLWIILLQSGLLVFLLLVAVAIFAWDTKRIRAAWCLVLLGWLGYFVFIGGDHYQERHLVSVYILAGAVSGPFWLRVSRMVRWVFVLVVALVVLSAIFLGDGRFDYLRQRNPDPWILLGETMAADRDAYGVLVLPNAGKIPFYAGGDCIDALGLNDPDLARMKRSPFWPGHSAGSYSGALTIASQHATRTITAISFFDAEAIPGPESVLLWVDNRRPQLRTRLSQEDWAAAARSADPWGISLIYAPGGSGS